MKKCKGSCGLEKELTEFAIDRRMGDGLRAKCRACLSVENRSRWAKFPEEKREKRRECTRLWCKNYPDRHKAAYIKSNRKSKYGVDAATYQQMLTLQDNKCAICRQEETVKTNGKDVDNLAVDHDHETEKVRGLLCHRCNRGIGFMQESPASLRAAAAYLEQYGKT